MYKIVAVMALLGALLFTGCAAKDEEELSNKSASFWYQKIVHAIGLSSLAQADDYFSSLHSEHVSSPLLPQAMLMLSKAHAEFDELILAQYYLDEYLKRYGSQSEREYVEYLKVKLAFLNYRHTLRNQKFLDDTIQTITQFKKDYPSSSYVPSVEHMLFRLELGRERLKDSIVSLYKRLDKPKAVEFYENNDRMTVQNSEAIAPPKTFWLRKIFE